MGEHHWASNLAGVLYITGTLREYLPMVDPYKDLVEATVKLCLAVEVYGLAEYDAVPVPMLSYSFKYEDTELGPVSMLIRAVEAVHRLHRSMRANLLVLDSQLEKAAKAAALVAMSVGASAYALYDRIVRFRAAMPTPDRKLISAFFAAEKAGETEAEWELLAEEAARLYAELR